MDSILKILILEDINNDGKADKQTVFADQLHLPLGFEIASEGVYVSQGTNMMLLRDTNGDDVADSKEIILSGFDDHDTHHAHHAYTADPSGAIYMGGRRISAYKCGNFIWACKGYQWRILSFQSHTQAS